MFELFQSYNYISIILVAIWWNFTVFFHEYFHYLVAKYFCGLAIIKMTWWGGFVRTKTYSMTIKQNMFVSISGLIGGLIASIPFFILLPQYWILIVISQVVPSIVDLLTIMYLGYLGLKFGFNTQFFEGVKKSYEEELKIFENEKRGILT